MRVSNKKIMFMVGNELVLHMNEGFVPMNEMYGENKVSLDCMCVGDVDGRRGRVWGFKKQRILFMVGSALVLNTNEELELV